MKSARVQHIIEKACIPHHPMRVAVGLSGGVDSLMVAWLLREAGHDVRGLTMQIWDHSQDAGATSAGRDGCYGPGEIESIRHAKQLAERLGIPLHVVSLTQAYEQHVLAYYRDMYRRGLTPNPCAVCNPVMKFGLLPQTARAEGLLFDFFATGHYVVRRYDKSSGLFRLFEGADTTKDQSYFLARLEQDQLARSLFPLGGMTKREVRTLAREAGFGAEIAEKAESQDFYDGEDHGELFQDSPPPPGDIVDRHGKVIGRHRGIMYYTIGQREGLGVATGRRVYVSRIDPVAHRIVVGERDELLCRSCRVVAPSWISGRPPDRLQGLKVRLRYRHPGATIAAGTMAGEIMHLEFETPQFAITPGQLAAFYHEDELLGGGWIDPGPSPEDSP